ncbi:MAG: family 20 glycosylhydrolase [Clostridia bacterium]|nr:family 20 glycosylhydrolase [Clostridia bacterium]
MHIGSIFNRQCTNKVTYSYHKRGSSSSYAPDVIKEKYQSEKYDIITGQLFKRMPVSWDGVALLVGGIDLRIDFNEKVYVDYIQLVQGVTSECAGIDILTTEDGTEKYIGNYRPETGFTVTTETLSIPVRYYCDHIIIRINGAYKNFEIKLLDIFGGCDLEDSIYPFPQHIEYTNDSFSIDETTSILSGGDDDANFAANYLSEKFTTLFGKNLPVSKKGTIHFIHAEKDNDGFELEVRSKECMIKAGNRRAFLYAADVLLKLCDGNSFRACKITDQPFKDFRGVHLALPSRKDIPFFKNLVKNVFVPMRYNAVFIQFSAVMKLDKFPEINDAWLNACAKYEAGEWPIPPHYDFLGHDILEKDEVRELCAYIRSFGLEIIPEIQTWGHTQYITMAYPETAEPEEAVSSDLDLNVEDERPSEFYHHCMCPLHDRYYEITLGITDEIIEVVKPERFVHMGHDEIYHYGNCDKCKERDAAELYTEEVTKLNDHIKNKGLTMMIWSDMIQEHAYDTVGAVKTVPKDIIMLDFTWYFHPEMDLEDSLVAEGYQILMGNLYSSHYPRFERRIRKENVNGGEVSTWIPCNELFYAFEGKIFDLVYTANMLWHGGYRNEMRSTYTEILKPILWNIRKTIGKINFINCSTVVFEKNALVPMICDENYRHALLISKSEPESEISINKKSNCIRFTHATDLGADRICWKAPFKVGAYVLKYEDGSTYTEDILYGANIYKYDSVYASPLPSYIFRHEGYLGTYMAKPISGKLCDGSDYTLYEHYVNNPHPEKEIKTISVRYAGESDASVLLFEIVA